MHPDLIGLQRMFHMASFEYGTKSRQPLIGIAGPG